MIIAHGLFGMLDNWHTFASEISKDYMVITVDLRNHGRSFHDDEMSYEAMAEDVVNLMDHLNLKTANVLGHSMGGKMAAQLALSHPERVERCIVVDILPLEYERGHDEILHALNSVPVLEITSRREVEAEMLSYLQGNKSVVNFLMKSLRRLPEGGFAWRFNLDVLTRDYDMIRSGLNGEPSEVATLFIMGGLSSYISMDGWIQTTELFPKADLVEIKGAGHWVHVDKGPELIERTKMFLERQL